MGEKKRKRSADVIPVSGSRRSSSPLGSVWPTLALPLGHVIREGQNLVLQAALNEHATADSNGVRGIPPEDLGSTSLQKLTGWVLCPLGAGLKGLGNAGHELRFGVSVVIAFFTFVEALGSVRSRRDDKPVFVMIIGGDPIETPRWLWLTVPLARASMLSHLGLAAIV